MHGTGNPNAARHDLNSRPVPLVDVLHSGCRDVYDYWQSLRGDRFAPSWPSFDLMALPPKVVAYLRVVDVTHDPFDLIYRFWGTGLVSLLGQERTGLSLLRYKAVRVPQATAEYETVIRTRAPVSFVYDTRTSTDRPPLYAPAIRLPLSDTGETVDHVVAYADFQSDGEAWRRYFHN